MLNINRSRSILNSIAQLNLKRLRSSSIILPFSTFSSFKSTMATLGAPSKKHQVTIIGSGNWFGSFTSPHFKSKSSTNYFFFSSFSFGGIEGALQFPKSLARTSEQVLNYLKTQSKSGSTRRMSPYRRNRNTTTPRRQVVLGSSLR